MRSMSSPLTPACSTAAFTAVAPRSVAETSASAPCIEPIGVRAIERMTVGSSAMVAMGLPHFTLPLDGGEGRVGVLLAKGAAVSDITPPSPPHRGEGDLCSAHNPSLALIQTVDRI